jgi:integrase
MMNFTELASTPCNRPVPFTDQLRLAVAAYLARFKGSSREHTESDLRSFLTWCAERDLDPLAARRPHLELYIRWMQEVRRFKPSTVSRRFSVTAGFYRTCVIDGVLEHSPAEYVRRPAVSAESPTLGFTHLQFEALLTAARQSAHPCDFALVAMLGLLGLRIFDATGAVWVTCWPSSGRRRGAGAGRAAQARCPGAAAAGRGHEQERPERRAVGCCRGAALQGTATIPARRGGRPGPAGRARSRRRGGGGRRRPARSSRSTRCPRQRAARPGR